MTKEQLITLGLDEEQIKEVFKLNGIAVTKVQDDLFAKETELTDTKKLLVDANDKIKEFETMDIDKIKQEAKDYKEAYENAERDGKEKLEALQYETAIKDYASNFTFANERIKNSIISDLKQKEFKLEEGKLLGADDYMNQLKESEPTSFATEESTDKNVTFVRPNSNGKRIEVNKENIMAIDDPIERKRQIAEHIELFN